MVVRYGVAAEHELANAVETYDRERAGLGGEFLREVQRVASFLIDHPHLGRLVRKNRRVLVLNKFPYRLVYDVDKNGIRIIAVAHQSRRSDYWWGRVEEMRPQYGSLPAVAFKNWCLTPINTPHVQAGFRSMLAVAEMLKYTHGQKGRRSLSNAFMSDAC